MRPAGFDDGGYSKVPCGWVSKQKARARNRPKALGREKGVSHPGIVVALPGAGSVAFPPEASMVAEVVFVVK